MVLHAVAPASSVGALEILGLLRRFSRVVLTIATARCRYSPGDANVDDVDGLAVRVGTDDVGHAALALLHVGTNDMAPVLHLLADALEVKLPKELDEEVVDRVVGRGPVPAVLRAGALVVVAVLVAAQDSIILVTIKNNTFRLNYLQIGARILTPINLYFLRMRPGAATTM
jgi:hypothetical protein